MIDSKKQADLFLEFSEYLLPLLSQCITDQLNAGAEVVMILDTSAGSLSPAMYQRYVVPAIQKLCHGHEGRVAYYAKETTHDQIELLRDLPIAGFGYDHRFDMKSLLTDPKRKGIVQGNFDQTLLFSETEVFKNYLEDYLAPLKDLSPAQRKGWVCGVGHGILPKTPEANVRLFIETVREAFNA